ncbi:MAG TPA: type II secretion system protein GspC [Gammaproteobacteria bacterium]
MPATLNAPALARQLPGLASLLLVIALGVALAGLTWRLVPLPAAPELPAAAPAASAGTPDSRGSAELAGLKTPLFGEEPKVVASAPTPAVQEEAPVTTLALKLRGVAASDDPEEALAIVEGPDGKSLPYRIGDELPGEAELVAVHTDRIVLRRAGRDEVLPFADAEPGAVRRAPPVALARPTLAPAAGGSRQLAPDTSAKLREYLSVLPSDPSRLTELVRALPVMENGQLTGFRLFPGRQRDLFSEVGLRRGDIVTRVNGMPVNDPAQGAALLGQLSSASQVQVEIIRRGQAQVLDVRL